MAARAVVEQRAKRTGLGMLDPDVGLDALRSILDGSVAYPLNTYALISIVSVSWHILLRGAHGSIPYFFANVVDGMGGQMQPIAGVSPAGVQLAVLPAATPFHAAASMPSKARVDESVVLESVLETIQGILGAELSATQPLMEAGLDSLSKFSAEQWFC